MKIVYTIDFGDDLSALDEYVRTLYSGVEYNDPVPGEPEPGKDLLKAWAEEGLHNIHLTQTFCSVDTAWWKSEEYPTTITVEVQE